MKPRRNSRKTKYKTLHDPIETNLEYWMIHIVHWHALLFAMIVVVSIGYLFFNKQHALAYAPSSEDMISVYPQQ